MERVYEIELAIFGAFAGLVTPPSIYLAKKFIEPIFQLRELISEILYSLTFYENIYSNPGTTPNHYKVSNILSQHASNLGSKLYLVKYPQIPAFLKLIPSKANITVACSELIGISNMLFHLNYVKNIYDSSNRIRKLLNV